MISQGSTSYHSRMAAVSYGKSDQVLHHFGVPTDILDKKHHDCPICGAKKLRISDPYHCEGGCDSCGNKWGTGLGVVGCIEHYFPSRSRYDICQDIEHYWRDQQSTSREGCDESNRSLSTSITPTPPAREQDAKEFSLVSIDSEQNRKRYDKCVSQFCTKKRPIQPQAFEVSGGSMGYRKGNELVLSVPVYGPDLQIINHVCLPFTGGKMWPDGPSSVVGWSGEGKSGLLTTLAGRELLELGEPIEGLVVIRVEGVSDFLALSTLQTDGQNRFLIVSNSDGCRATKNHTWMADRITKLQPQAIWSIGDCDEPGQVGSNDFLAMFQGYECYKKNIVLPFAIEPKKGRDLRDFLTDHSVEDLVERGHLAPRWSIESIKDHTATLASIEPTEAQPTASPAQSKPIGVLELLRQHSELRPVLIEGLLRETEVCNIIASPKIGKSYLVLSMALSIATGCDWLGREVKQGNVLLVDNELHLQTLSDRVHKVRSAMGLSEPDIEGKVDILSLRGQMVDIEGLGPLLANMRDRYRLIVLDALYRFIPAGVSENDNAAITQIYNRLDSYATMTGSAIALVHHSSKGDQSTKGVTDVGAGAGSISRAADTHIILRQHETPGMAVMECVTRSFSQPEPLSIRRDYPLWVATTAVPVLKQKTNDQSNQDHVTDQAVLEVLSSIAKDNSDVWLSISQVKSRLGYGAQRAARSLSRLERAGKITSREEARKGHDDVLVFRAVDVPDNVPDNVPD